MTHIIALLDPDRAKGLYRILRAVLDGFAPKLRGGGHVRGFLDAAKVIAQYAECDHILFCYELKRINAHHFYEKNGLSGFSKQFIIPLKGT